MFLLNKLVLICGLFIIIPSAIHCETKGLIEYKNVRAGATVNSNQYSATSIEVLSSIFNENSTYPEIYRNFTEFVRYPPKWRSRQFNCMESVDSLTHPVVKTHDKFSSDNSIGRSFRKFEDVLLKQEKLSIDSKYRNNSYVCILYELCNLKEERIRKDVNIIDEDDLPANDDEPKYLTGKKAIFRVKQGVESDYVSSITKGTCLAQIYVYDKNVNEDRLFKNYADKKPIFESPLVSATNNLKLEKRTIEILRKAGRSLLDFENLSPKNQSEIFKNMESEAIRDFSLVPLPVLSEKLEKTTPSLKLWKELLPGDTLNVTELKDLSVPVIKSMHSISITEQILYNSDEDLSITIRTFKNDEKTESCPFEQLGVRSSDHINDHQGLEIFDCKLQKQQFGVPAYIKKGYQRMEVRVCRTIEKESLKEPVTIINWNSNYNDIGYNVFMDENIIVRRPFEGETHYVSAVHRGDCLYQALVYNETQDINHSPLFKSKLISVSDDSEFEEAVNFVLSKTTTNSTGLHQVVENEDLRAVVKKLFVKKAVLSIDFRSLRAERPPPQLNLFELYYNFGNSLQASLSTIFIISIVIKLFTN